MEGAKHRLSKTYLELVETLEEDIKQMDFNVKFFIPNMM